MVFCTILSVMKVHVHGMKQRVSNQNILKTQNTLDLHTLAFLAANMSSPTPLLAGRKKFKNQIVLLHQKRTVLPLNRIHKCKKRLTFWTACLIATSIILL